MDFEITAGSMVGRYHLGDYRVLKGKNNQDAYAIAQTSEYIVGVLADGCGSTPFAEVGSQMGVKFALSEIHQMVNYWYDKDDKWEGVRQGILSRLQPITEYLMAPDLAGNPRNSAEYNFGKTQVISDYLCFTLLGFLMTPEETTIFHIGDGLFFVNGEKTQWDYPFNAPPYISYDLMNPEWLSQDTDRESLKFVTHVYPTEEVQNLLIGTDGVEYLVQAAEKNIPGLEQKIGDISQFWTQDAYYHNSDLVRRKLSVVNKEHTVYNTETQRLEVTPGLLPDDCTLIAVRRRKEEVLEADTVIKGVEFNENC